LAGILPSRAAFAADKVILRTNWLFYGSHSVFFLGIDKGYYDQNGLDVVVKQGNGSGNTADWKEVRKLRGRLDGDFLWVRDGERRFVIQDSDVLEKIEDAFAPQSEIGARQSKLGAHQSRIGDQQSKIGMQQSRIGEQQSEIGAQQAEIAMRMARRQARGQDTRDLERTADELSDQMEALSRQQEKLSEQMEPFSRQQEELGSQMERLSREMERASRTTSRQVRALIERAIEDGSAEPLR